MSLDKEAVRLAYLSKANKRADERMLNIPQSEVQEGKEYTGGFMRRGLSSQMPRGRKARKFITSGRDRLIETMPDIVDKIPGVSQGLKLGLKGIREVHRQVKKRSGRGKTGGSHKNRYDVEEDVAITTGGERLKRVKGRGMKRVVGGAKKQSRKDREDEKLGAEIRGLKDKMSGGAKKMKKNAENMGEMYGSEVVAMDDDVKELVGSGFFEDFGRGFMKGLRGVSGIAKKVLPIVAPGVGSLASAGLSAVGLGKAENVREYMSESEEEEMEGGGLVDAIKTAGSIMRFLSSLSSSTRGKLASGEHLTGAERSALFKKLRGKGKMAKSVREEMKEMTGKGRLTDKVKELLLRKLAEKKLKIGGAGLQDDLAYTEAVNMNRTRSGGSKCRQGTEMGGRHSRKGGAMTGGRKRGQSEKMKKRNALVRKLMREEGMSLPQASKYIKENGLM